MTIREMALKLLSEHEAVGKYSNLALRSHMADKLEKKDRAMLTVLLYTAIEHRLTYDYWISALSGRSISDIRPHTKNILRIGLCQIAHMDSIPDFAAVNETVKLASDKGESAFVNGILRAFVRAKENGTVPLPDKDKNYARYLSVRESFSIDIVRALISELGQEQTEELLVYFNRINDTDITVNALKIQRNVYINILKDAGYNAELSSLSELGIKIHESVDPRALTGFCEGLFFVQDTACSTSVGVLAPMAGDLVIDTCSAPGGKSFAAAIMSDDEAKIYSFDLHESKLSLIKDGASRLGLSSITPEVRDALTPDETMMGIADKVICDVPCSGLGVLGKKSDLRYKSAEGFVALPELQYAILKNSAGYVKVGGRLVYSTCTLRSAENCDVVNRFITENEGFRRVDFNVGGISSKDGMLTLLPHKHGTDGFFIALIERVS